jgi:hypothetical protein
MFEQARIRLLKIMNSAAEALLIALLQQLSEQRF